MSNKSKGYRIERKLKLKLMDLGWKVVRAGGSLGEYDLIAFKDGRCVFFQIKSTTKPKLYYYGYMKEEYEKFPFRLVVDFGRGSVRVLSPQKVISPDDGVDFEEFIKKI
ncbi:hypothetical protein M1293_01405 [Candidatus Parvarchaeota archaeon]|nr:hypothetical protein [Candidatus Parvarchaeota archaeon]